MVMAKQQQYGAIMINNAFRALVCALLIILVTLVSGCARDKAGGKTDASRLKIRDAMAGPSGKVYTRESADYLGPFRYFILSKNGRKTELYPYAKGIWGVSRNDTLFATGYKESTKTRLIHKLTSTGKLVKTIPVPNKAFALPSGKRLVDTQIRGLIVDGEENVYAAGVQETKINGKTRYSSFLKKITPNGKVINIDTKYTVRWYGNIGDTACMAIDAENNLYVSEWSPDTKGIVVERIDPKGRGEIVADVPGGVQPDIINIDRQGNIFVGIRNGTWFKFTRGKREGVVIVSDEDSGPFRAKKPIKPKTYGSTDLWLMNIEYMWRLER